MHLKASFFLLAHAVTLSGAGIETGIDWEKSTLAPLYDPGMDFYAYAPSIIRDGDIERYWSCHNIEPGVVRDYIYYFERVDGQRSDGYPVLGPGPEGAWDGFHVCDPAVIEGEFRFEGEVFRYAMFYLGNNVDASRDNQIGVAFAHRIDGQWKRYPQPIVPFPPRGFWGVGQPSVTTLDRKGRVLLFYTQGDGETVSFRREMDLSDMDRPRVGPAVPITNEGLTKTDGSPDYLNNFSIAYDRSRDRFIAIRGQRPYEPDDPDYISPRLQIVSIASKHIMNGGGAWHPEGVITPEMTSRPRNHNAGIERTLFGELPDPRRIRVIFATACAAGDCGEKWPLWSYALWEIEGDILAPDSELPEACPDARQSSPPNSK